MEQILVTLLIRPALSFAMGALTGAISLPALAGAPGHSECSAGTIDSSCGVGLRAVTGCVGSGCSGGVAEDSQTVYSGPLAGTPISGFSYWGYDFKSAIAGVASPIVHSMFINRTNQTIAVTLRFDLPYSAGCAESCLPAVQFKMGDYWGNVYPQLDITATQASATLYIRPNEPYGWIIGRGLTSNTHLIVTADKSSPVTLQDAGLPQHPEIALEMPATPVACTCWDGSDGQCSQGTIFSNGLIGYWLSDYYYPYKNDQSTTCPPRGGPDSNRTRGIIANRRRIPNPE